MGILGIKDCPCQGYSQEYSVPSGIRVYQSAGDRLYAWFISCINALTFGFGAKVFFDQFLQIQNGNQTFYIHLGDFARKACEIDNPAISPDLFATSETVQRLFLEALNPIMGDITTIEKVVKTFEDFRSEYANALSDQQSNEEALAFVTQKLELFKARDLEVLRYDPCDLESRLQPGDILFKRQLTSQTHPVVLGQRIFQGILHANRAEREAYKYSHAAIYIGNGQIAEAVPHGAGDEIRILSLNDPRFALDPEHDAAYMIARPTDPTLGEEAAEIARKIADEVPPAHEEQRETTHQYTYWQALRSLYHSSSFGPYARYHYLKQYEDARHNRSPLEFSHKKNFFCSYLVGYSYQRAEGCRVCPGILGDEDAPSEGVLPVVGSPIRREVWALVRRLQHWTPMTEQIKLKFHAKRSTPQDLANFVINNPQLFNYKMAVFKPES